MTTLAEVLAEHQWDNDLGGCVCDDRTRIDDAAMAAHQAEMVAAAGLAVVELPEPYREKPPAWRVLLDGETESVYVGSKGGVSLSGVATFEEQDIPALAAALLAAANAAEGVR